MCATSLQLASNESVRDASTEREVLEETPSDIQPISPFGPQAEIVIPQQCRKPERKAPEPEKQINDQEKEAVPLRPLRRKDSLGLDHKKEGDALMVELLHSVKKVETVQKSNVVPPPRAKRNVCLPPDSLLRAVPYKPLCKKGLLEPSQDFDGICQTGTETIPLHSVDTKDQIATNLVGKASLREHTELISSKDIEEISCTQELPKKDNKTYDQATPNPSIIKRIRLPHKKTWSSKSVNNGKDNIISQNSNAINSIKFLHKSEDASKKAEVEEQKYIPVPCKKKHLNRSFPEDGAAGERAQGSRQDDPLFISPLNKELFSQNSKGSFLLGLQPPISGEEINSVILRRSRYDTERSGQVEDGVISEKTCAPSLPVPKPRVKKRLSGSFPDSVTISGSPPIFDSPNDNDWDPNGKACLPVPLPRAKRHVSATLSDVTTPVESEHTPIPRKEITEGSTSLDSSVISEDFVTIQGEDEISSEVEREVLAAMAEEEFPHVECVDDTERVLDELTGGWTFTDNPVISVDLEKNAISEQVEVWEAEVDRCHAPAVASSHGDWLHLENEKDNEVKSRKEMRDEELDFGFVSLDVAAGSVKVER